MADDIKHILVSVCIKINFSYPMADVIKHILAQASEDFLTFRTRKRVSNTVRVSPAQVHGGVVHRGAPPVGSDNGTRSGSSVRERGHRICTSLQQVNRALQPVFHSSKEGWGVASHFRSSSSERLRHAAQVQNVNFETNRVTDQIRGLVCHDRSQGRILPQCQPSVSQEVMRFTFGGKAYQ